MSEGGHATFGRSSNQFVSFADEEIYLLEKRFLFELEAKSTGPEKSFTPN